MSSFHPAIGPHVTTRRNLRQITLYYGLHDTYTSSVRNLIDHRLVETFTKKRTDEYLCVQVLSERGVISPIR